MIASHKLRQEFEAKKKKILQDLSSGAPDASPKGNVDDRILPLIELLNSHDGMVTTSSCSGRISVFLQGNKGVLKNSQPNEPEHVDTSFPETNAGVGGKGGGGKWLFVSHDPLPDRLLVDGGSDDESFLDTIFGGKQSISNGRLPTLTTRETRYVHLKFEPMILHILTESIDVANNLLSGAISCSFRESGIVSPLKNPVVAVRTIGLSFDVPVGVYDPDKDSIARFVDIPTMRSFLSLANYRFDENFKRMESLRLWLLPAKVSQDKEVETREQRAKRKRQEGLERQRGQIAAQTVSPDGISDPLEGGISF